jgi:hypothetical protein
MLTILMVAALIAAVAITANLLTRLAPFAGSLRARLSAVLATADLGAVTLADSQVVSPDPRLPGVLRVLETSTTVLDRLPFESIAGGAFTYNQDATLPAAAFRAVNAGYTESTGTYTTATESLVILGGEYVVDRFLEQTRSNGAIASLIADQRDLKVRSINAKFSDAFINGDTAVDANSFNGLKKRLTGAQVLSSGTNGAAINTDQATRFAFFDRLNTLLALVPGVDALYMNASVLATIRSAMVRETMINTRLEDLGARREVLTWNGVPMLDIGNKADQTPIIPQTETQGSSSVASSIYAVNFTQSLGEPGVVGITNGGLQVDPPVQLETKPSWMGRVEFYCGVALLGAKPAARLTGVLAS